MKVDWSTDVVFCTTLTGREITLGLRRNSVKGWQLNEGNVTLRMKLFDNTFEIS